MSLLSELRKERDALAARIRAQAEDASTLAGRAPALGLGTEGSTLEFRQRTEALDALHDRLRVVTEQIATLQRTRVARPIHARHHREFPTRPSIQGGSGPSTPLRHRI